MQSWIIILQEFMSLILNKNSNLRTLQIRVTVVCVVVCNFDDQLDYKQIQAIEMLSDREA